MIAGVSGSGKSFTAKRLLSSAARHGMEVDIFDVHEELDDIPGCIAVKFSQATKLGYNPLVCNTNIHSGGPMRQTEFLISLIKQVSPQLGIQQEAVLRNLCEDTYIAHGIFQDNPTTWRRTEVSEIDRIRYINSNQTSELKKFYPTLEDLKAFAMKKVHALALGADNESVTAWHDLASNMKKLNRLSLRYRGATDSEEIAALEVKIANTKAKYKEASSNFIDTIETGKEIDDVLKYRSLDVLQSVMARLDILNSNGIFRSNPPPFKNAGVRVYQLKSLTIEQQILFIKLQVQRAFDQAKALGPIPENAPPRRMIMIDEAHRYLVKDPDDILNVVAKESRKFGIALICSSQQPTHFPRDFLTNVGMTILCGIHGSFWKQAEGLFGINEATLSKVRPKEVIAVKLQKIKDTNPPFLTVAVPNPTTIIGKQVAAYAARFSGQ
jgi:hypothetical protein